MFHVHSNKLQVLHKLYPTYSMIQNIFSLESNHFQSSSKLDESITIPSKINANRKRKAQKVYLQLDEDSQSKTKQIFGQKKLSLHDFLRTTKIEKQTNSFLQNQQFQNEQTYFQNFPPTSHKNKQVTKQKLTVSKLLGDIKRYSKAENEAVNFQKQITLTDKQKLNYSFEDYKPKSKIQNNNNFSKVAKKQQKKLANCGQFQTDSSNKNESIDSNIPIKNRNRLRKAGNRQKKIFTKRIHMCGKCFLNYCFMQELLYHLKTVHKGQIPDGSIFGMKREELYNLFHIAFQKRVVNPMVKKALVVKCGCGKEYSCPTTLTYHIQRVHKGITPAGTIGATKKVNNKGLILTVY